MRDALYRVKAARESRLRFEDLAEPERVYFLDLLADELFAPDTLTKAYFKALVDEGGAVGEDEHGRLMRSLPGGDLEPIPE